MLGAAPTCLVSGRSARQLLGEKTAAVPIDEVALPIDVQSELVDCSLRLAEHLIDALEEQDGLYRFDHPGGRAVLSALLHRFAAGFRGQHEHWSGLEGVDFPKGLEHLQAVHFRHVQVTDDQVRLTLFGLFETVLSIRSLVHVKASTLENRPKLNAHSNGVIHDKNLTGHEG